MQRTDPAGTGVTAGAVVGLLTGALTVGSLLASRNSISNDLETALEMYSVGVDLPLSVVFWLTVVAGGLFRVVLGVVVGSLIGVFYGWLSRSNAAVLVAVVCIVGVIDGLTTNIGLTPIVTVGAFVGAWLCYVPVFTTLYHGKRDDHDVTRETAGTLGDIDIRAVLLLVGLGIVGLSSGLPYIAAINGLSIWTVAPSVLLTYGLLTIGSVLVGVQLGPSMGFDLLALRTVVNKELPDLKPLAYAAVLGLGVGIVLVGVDLLLLTLHLVPPADTASTTVAAWKQALLVLYGGFFEEILLRLGLLTGIVWLFVRFTSHERPEDQHVIGGIAVTALVFGVAHLPAAVSITSGLSLVVVARILLLNGIAGIAFGWLYWTRGILAAMAAHLTANVVLHIVTPLILTV